MIAVDSSVAVAAFGEWHALNEPARAVLDGGAVVPAHVLLETYAVLTGFPPPHRAPPVVVREWLATRFDDVLEAPGAAAVRDLVARLAAHGMIGGATFDGLVALSAQLAGAELVSADIRARRTYEIVGAGWRPLVG